MPTKASTTCAIIIAIVIVILIITLVVVTSMRNNERAITTLSREYSCGFWRATSDSCLMHGCADMFTYIGHDENLQQYELSGMSVIVRAREQDAYDGSLPDGLFRLIITNFSGDQHGRAQIVYDDEQLTRNIELITDMASGRMIWIIARDDADDLRIVWEKDNKVSAMLADS